MLDTIKTLAEVGKTAIEAGAIVVAGWWTYNRFIKTRSERPKATITHKVSHRDLPGGRTFLQVTAVIKNEGTVLLRIPTGVFRIQQVLPLPPSVTAKLEENAPPVPEGEFEVNWEGLGERRGACHMEIEPGEADQKTADFFLDDPELRLIEVYTYFQNVEKPEEPIGWGLTTLYDLEGSKGSDEQTFKEMAGRSEGSAGK